MQVYRKINQYPHFYYTVTGDSEHQPRKESVQEGTNPTGEFYVDSDLIHHLFTSFHIFKNFGIRYFRITLFFQHWLTNDYSSCFDLIPSLQEPIALSIG